MKIHKQLCNMEHELTLTARFYVKHHPATQGHLAAIVKGYLQGKGVPTEQEYKEGKPVHKLTICPDDNSK